LIFTLLRLARLALLLVAAALRLATAIAGLLPALFQVLPDLLDGPPIVRLALLAAASGIGTAALWCVVALLTCLRWIRLLRTFAAFAGGLPFLRSAAF
jgi:hypothetical protein